MKKPTLEEANQHFASRKHLYMVDYYDYVTSRNIKWTREVVVSNQSLPSYLRHSQAYMATYFPTKKKPSS